MSEQRLDQHLEWRAPERPDLRTGVWTRLGDHRVLGDQATEVVLGSLAERTRSAARAEGYAVGWAEGHRAGVQRAETEAAAARAERERLDQQWSDEHAAALAALTTAAQQLVRISEEVAARIADQATDLAMELTETLVGYELTVAQTPGAGVVSRALTVLPQDPMTLIRVHPEAAATVAEALQVHGVDVIADAGLDRGDAVVETDTTAVDLRIGTAIARLREALS